MFQIQILPNTGGFWIYGTHKCIHNRTVHRGPHWRVNHQPLDCRPRYRQYLLAGLTNLWHADPKWHAAFTAVPVLFYFFCPTGISVLWRTRARVCVCVHIWLRGECVWVTVATKQYCEWTIFTQIGSGGKCWGDIYHWGAGLAVTGRIIDNGQNVLVFFSNGKY